MRGKLIDLAVSLSGRQRLTVEIDGDFRKDFDELRHLDVDVSIKKYRARRSLDANGYAWVLIDKIAARAGVNKVDVYRDHIRQIGGVSEVVCVREQAADRLREGRAKRDLGRRTDAVPSQIEGGLNLVVA